MSISFQNSDAGISFKGNAGQSRNQPPGIRISVAVAIFPWQGWGNKFLTGSISDPSWGTTSVELVGTSSLCTYAASYDLSDLTFTKTKFELRTDFSNGSWQKKTYEYFPFWINGFGNSTLVISEISYSSPPPPTGLFVSYNSVEPTVVSDSKISRTAHVTIGSTDYDVIQSVNLSEDLFYDDVVSKTLTALETLPIPNLPDANPIVPNGAFYSDLIWPDTVSSLAITNGTPITYFIGAALGMATDSGGTIIGGSIASQYAGSGGFPANAIFAAKSVWAFTASPYGYGTDPTPPFNLYCRLLDTALAPQAVQDLSTEFYAGQMQVFTPSASTTDYGHGGSDIPNYPFSGSYAPPYSPGGYGEIGFNSATYP